MATFRFVINDKKETYQIEKEQKDSPVLGKKIGDSIAGEFLGLSGYEMEIKGGSDKDGFPMRKDIEGGVKRSVLIKKGVGFKGRKRIKKKIFSRDGLRRKKTVRGNTVTQEIAQISCKVTKTGQKPLAEILGKREHAGKETKEETTQTGADISEKDGSASVKKQADASEDGIKR